MSAASRSKVRARARHREQVARAIAELELPASIVCGMCQGSGEDLDTLELEPAVCELCKGSGSGRVALALALLSDPEQGFDVHAAREHAKALVLYGHHAHPELPSTLDTVPTLTGHDEQHVRLGRRILAALEGQPSECQGLAGFCYGGYHEHWGAMDAPCHDCRGTGHNLRGSLPPVEWSPQLVRKVADSVRHAKSPGDGAEWTARLYRTEGQAFSRAVEHMPGPREPARLGTNRPRVVPRGEHRCGLAYDYAAFPPGDDVADLDTRIESRGWLPRGSEERWTWLSGEPYSDTFDPWRDGGPHMPKWRLGELRHAAQRVERAAAWTMTPEEQARLAHRYRADRP